MARSLPRNVKPSPSGDPADKLCAALNWPIGKFRGKSGTYQKAPLYFDACWDWYQALTEDQHLLLTRVSSSRAGVWECDTWNLESLRAKLRKFLRAKRAQ
jgi:hypothetical protein